MKRLFVVALAMLTAVSWALAASWPGRPKATPPRLHQQGPPPAWVETLSQSKWMAFSSYCWSAASGSVRKAVCADMIPPQSRNDLPTLTVRRGQMLRIHLAYSPREAHVTLFHRLSFQHDALRPGRVLAWRVAGSGVVSVDTRAASGEAAYLVRLNVR
jgi:hypothetical protein